MAHGAAPVAPHPSLTSPRDVSLYGQEPEARLLAAFLPHLDRSSVIDVGAERGAFADELLRAGSDEVYVIDPEPTNAAFLRDRFRADPRVSVLEYAISDADGELDLHKSVDASGAAVTFGHTVLVRPDTDEIAWRGTVSVNSRSVASLVESGELPPHAGILKIDTEGHDISVVAGMGRLDVDVVMVEHWHDLPKSLGPCPWSTEEMVSALGSRGFSHYAFIEHRGEFVILKWDNGVVPVGHMGNLVFLHDRVLEGLYPVLLECASSLAELAVGWGEMYAQEAERRFARIEKLSATAEQRLARINELTRGRRIVRKALKGWRVRGTR